MGEYKKQIGIIIGLILLILILLITSCSPIKRHARLVKKYPFVHKTDTVILKDTIRLNYPVVEKDTIIKLDSFLVNLKDTITITKDNLIVKLTQIHDSIYIDAKCDTIFIDKIIERKIPVKYFEVEKESNWKSNIFYILYLFLILLLLIIVLKVIQFLKK